MSHHHALVNMPLTYILLLRLIKMGCSEVLASRVKCGSMGYWQQKYHPLLPTSTPSCTALPPTITPIGLGLYVVLDKTVFILSSILILMHYAVPPVVYAWSNHVPRNFIIVANVVLSWKSLWSTTDVTTTTGFIYAGPADHCRGFNTSSRLLFLAIMIHLLLLPSVIISHLLNHHAPPDPAPRLHSKMENNVLNVEILQAYNGSCASSYSGRVPSSVVACTLSDGFISRLLTSVVCDPPSHSTTDVYMITTPDFYGEICGILIPMS